MGTSIAQASDLTEISCVENNQEHIAELQKKNLYKSIYQSLDEVQDRFDLVIICTRQDKVLHYINEVSKQGIGLSLLVPMSLQGDISHCLIKFLLQLAEKLL